MSISLDAVAEGGWWKPNIILVMTDDQGYGDLGCYGSETIPTPNLDRLAEEGMKLTDFHTAAPICTPSRAALLTGRYAIRCGLPTPLHTPDDYGLHPKENTLAEILKKQGYRTACIGKWHLGHHPPFYPTRHGFDHYYGTPLRHCFRTESFRKRGEYSDLFLQGEERVDFPSDEDLTRLLTNEAIRYVNQSDQRPFFLWLSHCMPHFPLAVTEEFEGASKDGLYGDVITCLDHHFGSLYEAIHKSEIENRTLLIFLSDNGSEKRYGGSNRPYRGWKHEAWEGGHRVPCLVWGPGPVIDGQPVPGGSVCDELVTAMDLFPTLAGVAGASIPEEWRLDGQDIRPLLKGHPETESPHEAVFLHVRHGKIAGVRTRRWKLLVPCRAGPYRLDEVALFDLAKDPGETKNLAGRFPEKVARLRKLMEKHRADLEHDSRPPLYFHE